jgi:hypothetical protein
LLARLLVLAFTFALFLHRNVARFSIGGELAHALIVPSFVLRSAFLAHPVLHLVTLRANRGKLYQRRSSDRSRA